MAVYTTNAACSGQPDLWDITLSMSKDLCNAAAAKGCDMGGSGVGRSMRFSCTAGHEYTGATVDGD
ncbi:hypothetical protein HKX48_008425, partial [Thoreauomyces humboldtii]